MNVNYSSAEIKTKTRLKTNVPEVKGQLTRRILASRWKTVESGGAEWDQITRIKTVKR